MTITLSSPFKGLSVALLLVALLQTRSVSASEVLTSKSTSVQTIGANFQSVRGQSTTAFPKSALAEIDVEDDVESTLAKMTFNEKVRMLSGTVDEMHLPGCPRLHIPELKMSDGPIGVRNFGKSTAYPCGAMLASSWDIDLAREYGNALGRDCRARQVEILLGPGVDLYRVPQCGRNFEYFGEDPYLSAQIAVGYVLGVEGQHVATSVKHYAANDQETQRMTVDTIVGERRLHEICLPPFKATVQAGAGTVMAAYNKVNGYWCTANRELLTDILRTDWEYKGVLMSDWGAVHEFLAPFKAGTDWEMGSTKYYTPENVKHHLQTGAITESELNEHVRRTLRLSLRLNKQVAVDFDGASLPKDDSASAAVALKTAREGVVLLKNEDGCLPLNSDANRNIVVLGPNACPAVIWAGGSAQTIPFHSLSLLDAIKGSAGQSTKVEYIPACTSFNPTGELAFSYQGIFEPIDGGDRGLRADYFENDNLEGPPKASRIDAYPTDWHGDNDGPEEIKTQNYSVRWTGKLVAPQTDSYVLAINATSTRVMLDGKIILDTWFNTANGAEKQSVVIGMQKNEKHEIVIEHRKNSKNYSIQFTWGKAKPALTGEEKELIRNADAVIYAAGFNPHLESEGVDRSYELPGDQSEELRRLGTLNKRVIAVMNAGGNFGMQNWIDYVPGLICAWYPGQNGNQAVAEILFGDLNPSGHLPDTFEKRWEDSPAYGNYPGDRKNGGTVKYEEAIYSGYRWYDKKNISPRFPFGYGLSYTTFSVQNLSTVSTQGINVNNGRDSTITVTADVTNTGKRKGDCVVQLYVRPMDESIDRPVQELKGFSRVSLEPNQSKKITLQLNRDAFGTYDEHKHNWIHPAGRYEIALGLSSREIQASKTVSFAGDTSH